MVQIRIKRGDEHLTPRTQVLRNTKLTLCTQSDLLTILFLSPQTWFKNRRAKQRKLGRQKQTHSSSSPGASTQINTDEVEETPFPTSVANTHAASPGISDAFHHHPREPHGGNLREEAGASGGNSSPDSEPFDIEQILLGDPQPAWGPIDCDIDELVQLYGLPDEEDLSTLDQYLFSV
uniref:Homeobox domain-containing protein n=1 Tax=Microcebus murinus TaxID=30608 RepID=A0A8C5XX04_MICMU